MGKMIHPDDSGQVSKQFPLSVDDMSVSSSIESITGETVSLYYSNSGTRTTDAGQAAGTAVHGNFANKNILDAGGGRLGTFNDTSIAFTGNCFTSEVKFPSQTAEAMKNDTWANKLSAITSGFSNGQYCVDYRSGDIYGVKATTTSSLTSTSYKINQGQAGVSAGLSTNVNVSKIGGVATIADDGAFTAGTSTGFVSFGFADETATDSVGEGDVGALRMTLNRRLITASDYKEDTQHTDADYGSFVLGVRNDTLAALGGTDGDYAPLQVDANGALYTLDSNSAAIKTAVEIMDDWDESDRAKVNPIVGQAGISAGSAAVGATTPSVTLATDDPAVTALQLIDDTIATLGTTTYTEASSKGSIISAVRNDTLATLADTDNEIAPLQVNASGALYTSDSADMLTALQIMDDWDESDRAKVNPIAGQAGIAANAGAMDALTTRVTVATDDTHFGSVGAAADVDGVVHGQLRSIGEAVETLDDTVATLGTSTYSEATTKGNVIGAVRNDALAALADTDNEIAPLQVDAGGALYQTHSVTGIADGVKTVTTAGTDEALAGSTTCKRVIIQAQTDNTGYIAVGNSGVDATEATGTGVLLAAGEAIDFEIDNLADIYIDSTVNGEGVRFTYFT